MALTLLENVKNKLLGLDPFVAAQQITPAIGDFLKGFVGQYKGASPYLSPQVNQELGKQEYVPQNTSQKLGSLGERFLADLVATQGAGINDIFNEGTKTLLSIPKVSGLVSSGEEALSKVPQKIINTLNRTDDTIVKEVPKTVAKTETLFKKVAPDLSLETASKPGNVFNPKGPVRKTAEALFGNSEIAGSKGVIRKSGPAGEMIVNLLDKSESEGSRLAGEATLKLQNALKTLSKEEISSFADVVEGKIPAVSQPQLEAVNVWKNIANDVQTLAKSSGIDMGIIEKYFPHQTLPIEPKDLEVYAQDLVKQGKFETVAEALQSLQKEVSGLPRNASRRFGNLELSRESNLPYSKDVNVLFDYIKNAYSRIADVNNFGQNDEVLYKLAKVAGTQGGDTNQIAQYIDQILGKNQIPSKISKKITGFQTISKLNPGTSLTNLTQNLSTAMRTDIPSTAGAIGNAVSNPELALSRAVRVGEIDQSLIKGLEDYVGSSKVASKWIRVIGMEGTERFNRIVAVNAGYDYAAKLASKAVAGDQAAIRELARLGIKASEIAADGTLPEEALLRAGKSVSQMTQFSTNAGDLPYAWKTEAGKVITQFKSFAYKQTGFLKNEAGRISSEAAQGNIKPLVNSLTVFGIAAPIAGEIVNDFKSLLKNRKRSDVGSLTERYFSNILAATSFGLLDSTGALFGQYGDTGIISTLGGPTVSDVSKVIQGVSDVSGAVQGRDNVDLRPDARNLLREAPIVGQAAANTLVPNSRVDNYLGPNNGLSTADNETYKILRQTDPAAAEKFKASNQTSDKQPQGQNLLQKLFSGGEKFDWSTKPTTKKGKTEYNSMVDKALESNAEIPDEALLNRFFDGVDYQSAKTNSKKEAVLKAAMKVQNDEYLTEEQKAQIIGSAKINPDDLNYYSLASMNEDAKIQGTLDFLDSSPLDHEKMLIALALNKRRVGGAYITTPAVLDRLYDGGYISKADKALLTAIKWDSVYNKFYMDRDYKGSGTGMTTSKLKSYIRSINSIFKTKIQPLKLDTGSVAPPKAPKPLVFR